ncbi:MAG: hypothetical protein K5773_08240 [Pseudobutyrivibrio sp.]|nr:hypothetical protein [Pseudobutyrivibrio sp.]
MATGRENSLGYWHDLWSTSVYFYFYRGGTTFAYFMHSFLNPLNLHIHLGHLYGIYMMVWFGISTVIYLYSLKVIIAYVIPDISEKMLKVTRLIVIAVMFSTFYYSEVYNWYVGMCSYLLPNMMLFLFFAFLIKYVQDDKKKDYILMMATGIYASNHIMWDIPLGLFFLYVVYYKPGFDVKDIKRNLKKAIPLFVFILFGLSGVLAPGNYVRQTQYTNENWPSVHRMILQVLIDVAERTYRIIVDHPFTVLLLLMLVIIGAVSNADKRQKVTNPIFVFILGMIASCGCLFPYIFARGFTNTYVDVRVQYPMDYFIELTLCITAILIGRAVAYKLDLVITDMTQIATCAFLGLFAYACVINNYGYMNIVQVDVLKSRGLITGGYNLWDGILTEIENSSERNVVIDRDYNVTWSPYFLYSGLDDGVSYDDGPEVVYSTEHIMPNVYYQKDSIELHIPEAK